jgi:hypothetical protein
MVNLTGKFTDPGSADTHTALWSFTSDMYGNLGSEPGTVDSNKGVTGSKRFDLTGVFGIGLTVTDKDRGAGFANTINGPDGLPAFVVVYDPSGGFVTGGGWINSPAGAMGAMTAFPDAFGKASFGFVAKYKKGATVPEGNTEFQFKAGNLNFKSTDYQWLVVSGARAQFKGEGMVNGVAGYGFLLTAVDGQVNGGGGTDKFRIKIWIKGTNAVVYDNQMGDSEDASATTVIGGGSIVIHSK